MQSHFYSVLSRMKYIKRWALMRNTKSENLSEHSLEVAFIAHALCIIKNRRLGGNLNADRAAVLALFHDTTEILTGDLPTPVKYYSEDIKTAYKEIENRAGDKLLSLLPDDLRPDFESIYGCDDKELLKEVKAADKLSALIKCINERMAGNREFSEAEEATRKSIEEMNMPEANMFMEEFLESYGYPLDQQLLK